MIGNLIILLNFLLSKTKVHNVSKELLHSNPEYAKLVSKMEKSLQNIISINDSITTQEVQVTIYTI